jgi:multimeric flavodoxin WrbA
MLKKVLDPLEAAGWSTEYLQIGGKQVRVCMACMKCIEKRNGRCVIENDDINYYLERMYAADAIILGSPTYFADVTSEMKALIDRAGFVALANGGRSAARSGPRWWRSGAAARPTSSTPSITCSSFLP